MMKKLWTTLVVSGLVLMTLTAVVPAEDDLLDNLDDEQPVENEKSIGYKNGPVAVEKSQLQSRQQTTKCMKIRFKGIWGFSDDNETDGYVAGYIKKRGRVGILRGVWNYTDNESKGRIKGIFRCGYFNGRVITPGGATLPITGLYRADKENQTVHLRWMTPRHSGWAHFRSVSI